MSGVNPQGVHVSSFKTPSAEELGHDFLWRHVRRLPARGEIGIFNRSHYEEVLIVRVHPENLEAESVARTPDLARVCAAAVIAHTLIGIDPHYPVLDEAAHRELQQAELEAE